MYCEYRTLRRLQCVEIQVQRIARAVDRVHKLTGILILVVVPTFQQGTSRGKRRSKQNDEGETHFGDESRGWSRFLLRERRYVRGRSRQKVESRGAGARLVDGMMAVIKAGNITSWRDEESVALANIGMLITCGSQKTRPADDWRSVHGVASAPRLQAT